MMKKILMTVAVLGCAASIVSAQTVSSANVVGYAKIVKPGSSELNIMGVPFINGTNALNELLDINSFSGDSADPGAADQVILWNSGTQAYTTLALYQIAGYPQYTDWQLFDDFAFGATGQNPVLPVGSSIFVRGSTVADENVIISGEAILDASVTNTIVIGLQLIANPFSSSVHVTNLSFSVSGTTDSADPGAADQIIVWDTDAQQYVTLALYGIAGYPQYTQWMYFDDFQFGAAAPDITIAIGDGFWYRAQTGFQWVEANPYLGNL